MSDAVLNDHDRPSSGAMFFSVAIFAGGAALGAIAALLLAPQAGRESRKQLGEYGRRTGATISEWADAAYERIGRSEKAMTMAHEDGAKPPQRDESVKPRPHALAH